MRDRVDQDELDFDTQQGRWALPIDEDFDALVNETFSGIYKVSKGKMKFVGPEGGFQLLVEDKE